MISHPPKYTWSHRKSLHRQLIVVCIWWVEFSSSDKYFTILLHSLWHYPSPCSRAISVDVIKYPDNKQFKGGGYFNTQFQVRLHHCRKIEAGTCTRIGKSREKWKHACCLLGLCLVSPLLNSSGPPAMEWWPSLWAFHINNIIKTIPHKHTFTVSPV